MSKNPFQGTGLLLPVVGLAVIILGYFYISSVRSSQWGPIHISVEQRNDFSTTPAQRSFYAVITSDKKVVACLPPPVADIAVSEKNGKVSVQTKRLKPSAACFGGYDEEQISYSEIPLGDLRQPKKVEISNGGQKGTYQYSLTGTVVKIEEVAKADTISVEAAEIAILPTTLTSIDYYYIDTITVLQEFKEIDQIIRQSLISAAVLRDSDAGQTQKTSENLRPLKTGSTATNIYARSIYKDKPKLNDLFPAQRADLTHRTIGYSFKTAQQLHQEVSEKLKTVHSEANPSQISINALDVASKFRVVQRDGDGNVTVYP